MISTSVSGISIADKFLSTLPFPATRTESGVLLTTPVALYPFAGVPVAEKIKGIAFVPRISTFTPTVFILRDNLLSFSTSFPSASYSLISAFVPISPVKPPTATLTSALAIADTRDSGPDTLTKFWSVVTSPII